MAELLVAVERILDDYGADRISVRHLCYRLASLSIIPKTEAAFRQVSEHLVNWRFAGLIPFGRFVDATRWHYGETTFDSLEDAIADSVRSYRKSLWREQPYFVEVWVEKEAVASIVSPAANQWGIRTFVCRGFASITSTWEAASTFREALEVGKQPVILYLGDHDKAGHHIDGAIRKHFAHYGIGRYIEFRRVAVLPEQIEAFDLPTRPSKTAWEGGECVEIDTLSSAQIRDLLKKHIVSLIEPNAWKRLRSIEAAERSASNEILAATGKILRRTRRPT